MVFLVHSASRRTSTEAALASVVTAGDGRVTFRIFTLEQALAYVQGLLPGLPEATTPPPNSDVTLFGAEEQRTVNAFVVESTAALAQANAALRRHGGPEVADPPSTARMLAFLRRAQGALKTGCAPRRQRG